MKPFLFIMTLLSLVLYANHDTTTMQWVLAWTIMPFYYLMFALMGQAASLALTEDDK